MKFEFAIAIKDEPDLKSVHKSKKAWILSPSSLTLWEWDNSNNNL